MTLYEIKESCMMGNPGNWSRCDVDDIGCCGIRKCYGTHDVGCRANFSVIERRGVVHCTFGGKKNDQTLIS